MTYIQPVQVIRYVRPRLANGTYSNLGGATFVFNMDYNTRTVKVQTALCSMKDNFDKALGLRVAHASNYRVFNLDKFQTFADAMGGFTNAYLVMLKTLELSEQLSASEKVFLKNFNVTPK